LTIKNIVKPPVCSECGLALSHDNMPSEENKEGDKRISNMRKCTKCGYITDVEAREIEDRMHAQAHREGRDPLGKKYSGTV
jgi:predicted Zn-ribbon and HTH transcriptional regulator